MQGGGRVCPRAARLFSHLVVVGGFRLGVEGQLEAIRSHHALVLVLVCPLLWSRCRATVVAGFVVGRVGVAARWEAPRGERRHELGRERRRVEEVCVRDEDPRRPTRHRRLRGVPPAGAHLAAPHGHRSRVHDVMARGRVTKLDVHVVWERRVQEPAEVGVLLHPDGSVWRGSHFGNPGVWRSHQEDDARDRRGMRPHARGARHAVLGAAVVPGIRAGVAAVGQREAGLLLDIAAGVDGVGVVCPSVHGAVAKVVAEDRVDEVSAAVPLALGDRLGGAVQRDGLERAGHPACQRLE